DFHPSFKQRPDEKSIYGVEGRTLVYALESAARHIVQTEHQAQLLREQYGREAVVLPNPISLVCKFPRAVRAKSVLWIGKSDWIKRPELVLETAERLPD